MADTKISDLGAATAADAADLLVVVDVSDTSMAASGTNKQIEFADLLAGYTDTVDLVGMARAYTAAQYHATEVLAYASTVDWDVQEAPNAELTLTGPCTLDASNLADGVTGYLFLRQDGTGGHTLTFGAAFSGTDGTMPTVDTAASALTVVPYVVEGGAVIVPSDPPSGSSGDAESIGSLDVGSSGVLTDPNADRILFWDDSAGVFTFLVVGSGLSLSGTTLTASGGGGSAVLAPITWDCRAASFPGSGYPTFDERASRPVLDFDDTTEEACHFRGVLAGYNGGTLTVNVVGMATSATSGNVVIGVAWERLNTDLDSDSFATEKTATVAVNGTSGIPFTASVTFSSSEIDGTLIGEPFRLKIARKAADGSDTATGDYELILVALGES